jgi:hypothetical protein
MMKTLITALTLATLVAVPAFTQEANAAPNDRGMYQGYVTYQGYPLNEWYRTDNW